MWLIWATYINMSSMVLSLTPTIHTSSIMNTSGVEYYDLVTGQDSQKPIHPKLSHQLLLNQSNVYSQVFLECFLDSCWPISHYTPYTYNILISNLLLNSNVHYILPKSTDPVVHVPQLHPAFMSCTCSTEKRGACN